MDYIHNVDTVQSSVHMYRQCLVCLGSLHTQDNPVEFPLHCTEAVEARALWALGIVNTEIFET